MSIYLFEQWPSADQLALRLGDDNQAEMVIVADDWPTDQQACTPAGEKILLQWQQAKSYWQQQPVFSYPINQGKMLLIQPEYYPQWRLHNVGVDQPISSSCLDVKPWLMQPDPFAVRSVVVIGAGIAGAATAFALAQRNIAVTVVEQAEIANAGSGNHQGLLYAKISAHSTLQTELLLAGYGYSLALLDQTASPKLDCGVLHINFNAAEERRNQQISAKWPESQLFQSVSSAQAAEIAGIEMSKGGLWWPHGVTANPRSVVEKLLSHPLITLMTQTQVTRLRHDGQFWQIQCQKKGSPSMLTASHIVICAGAQSNLLDPIAGWPMQMIGGQTTTATPGDYAGKLRCALSGNSYITPAWQNKMCFGATFHPHCHDAVLTQEDENINWQELSELAPKLALDLASNDVPQGHVAVRCDTYDHLPVVGAIGNGGLMKQVYEKLKYDKNFPVNAACPWLPGAFVNTAHGSRGLATAPICAEAVASAILGLPSPFSARLQQALHPNRLLIRTLTHHRHFN